MIPIESWNHCPRYENPADLPSRGMSAEALQESQIWWHGPPWLLEGKDEWPNQMVVTELPSEHYDEMRSCDKPKGKLIRSTGLVVESRITSLSNVLDPDKFSDFKCLIRVTAFVLRFLRNLKSKRIEEKLFGPLNIDEYESAEILWLKEMQKAVVRSPKFESLKQQLGLYSFDHGLLKCKGRLQNSSIPFDAKHPILLPADHHSTMLIIEDCHKRTLHNGVKGNFNRTEVSILRHQGKTNSSKGDIEGRKLQENRRQALCHPTNCTITSIWRRREPCLYKDWN